MSVIQQSQSKITVDLGLQLDFDVEVEFQSQTELFTSALVFLAATTSQASKSLAGGVTD
jgi:hypothetical protein